MNEYLTDEELHKLVMEIEMKDMAVAPKYLKEAIPELLNNIKEKAADSHHVRNYSSVEPIEIQKDKIREFRKYRRRVIAAVAAAVAFLILVPERNALNGITGSAIYGNMCSEARETGFLKDIGESNYLSELLKNRRYDK